MALQSLYRYPFKTQLPRQQTNTSFVLDEPEPETITSKDIEDEMVSRSMFYDAPSNIRKIVSRNFMTTSFRDVSDYNTETISTYARLIQEKEGSFEEAFRGTFTIKHHYKMLFTKEVEIKTSELPRLKPSIPTEWRSLRDDEE